MPKLSLYFFLIIICFASNLAQAAPVVDVGGDEVALTDFQVGYFTGDARLLDYEGVREQTFEASGNIAPVGTGLQATWYRIALHNSSTDEKQLYLHLPKAYQIRSIEVFEERADKLIGQTHVDLNDASSHPLMHLGTVIYPFSVPAGETTVFYVYSQLYSHHYFAAEVFDLKHSREAVSRGGLDIALMAGMLLALVFYNCLLFFASRKSENILYSLYLVSGVIWISLSYGLIARVFSAYGDSVFILNLSGFTILIFLLLFMMAIFETRRFYPTEHRFLQGMLALIVVGFCYGLFDIIAVLEVISSLVTLTMVVTSLVSVSLLLKGNPLIKFFLIGHLFFVLFNGLAMMYYKGIIEPNYFNSHGVVLGIVLEALMLAFIISYRIRVLEKIRSQQAELKRQAATDPLTAVFNRRYFMVEGEQMAKQAASKGEPTSVIAVDIDHFKAVNDTYGHQAGDRVLIDVAEIFRKISRDQDLISRFGGEEFMILLPGTDTSEAQDYAERIRGSVEQHVTEAGNGVSVQVTVSAGIAEMKTPPESLEKALDRADNALYEAKEAGRNQVRCAP